MLNSPDGFNDVLEHLMQAAGPQGPIPASEVVIKGLPRYTLTETTLGKSTGVSCRLGWAE